MTHVLFLEHAVCSIFVSRSGDADENERQLVGVIVRGLNIERKNALESTCYAPPQKKNHHLIVPVV